MLFIAFVMVGLTILVYAASALEYRGHPWADEACAGVQSLCDSPHYVAIAAIVVIAIMYVMRTMKAS
jgi:uncharacterized membrane protein YidH (DUF202 family)